MKMTPVVAGTPTPQSLAPETSAPPERREAAIRAALGEGKVTPVESPVADEVKAARENIRRIKMKTNFSTNEYNAPTQDQVAVPETENTVTVESDAQNGISANSEEIEGTVEETKPISPQFAALARQRRALQVKESEIRQREAALAAKESTTGSTDYLQLVKANPLGVLREAGVSYDELTQAVLNDQNGVTPEITALKAEIKALKEGVDKSLSERDTMAERQALSEMKREAERLVATGDDFEMIRETNSIPDVMQLIHRVYKTEGVVLDVQEAATLVENELLMEIEKKARIKKVQNRLNPAQPPQQNQLPQQQERQMRTLTNRDGARIALSRRDRAIAAALGQL